MSFADVIEGVMGEFRARYSGRYFGRFRAVVTSNADPKQIARIRVKCPVLFAGAETGWCWPAAGMGANSSTSPAGMFAVPEVGDMVWIEFEEGNTGKPPVWSHGPWSSGSVPWHGRAQPDDADEGIKGIDGAAIPPSAFGASEYGKVRVWQMPSGSRIEFDETEGEERVQLFHKSGAHIEMLSDGTVNIGAVTNLNLQATSGQMRRYVGGALIELVEGGATYTVGAARTETVGGGSSLSVAGTYTCVLGGVVLTVNADVAESILGARSTVVAGNDVRTVGGQSATMTGTDWMVQASGGVSLVAMNNVTNGGAPTDLALEVTAYNSLAQFMSTDATGEAMAAYALFDGTIGTMEVAVTLAGIEMVGLHGDSTGIAYLYASTMLQLGSNMATEPLWLGTQAASLWASLLIWLDSHTHSTAVGATSPPLVPSSATLTSMITPCLSTKVFGE